MPAVPYIFLDKSGNLIYRHLYPSNIISKAIAKLDSQTGRDTIKEGEESDMKKEKPSAVKKIRKAYEKPLLTRHQKLTSIIAGILTAN